MRRQVLGFCFLIFFLAPSWTFMFAQAQGGTISVFDTGSAEVTISTNSGQHDPIGFDLVKNTTITSSSFFIKPDSGGSSPGALELDVNWDGLPEWSFNQTGYGDFGNQNMFANGTAVETMNVISYGPMPIRPASPAILMPSGATVSSAQMNVGFSPNLTGGFFETGYIHHVSVGDVNGDNLDDFVLYSQTANLTPWNATYGNGSNGSSGAGAGNGTNATNGSSNLTIVPAFRILSYSNVTGVTFSAWEETCTNVSKTFAADLNGDGRDDVINYVPESRTLCIHMVNSTTGSSFEPQINLTLSSTIRDFDFIDFDGNGVDELVSVRSSGVVSLDYYKNRTNSFVNIDAITLYNSGTTTPANLSYLLVDYFDGFTVLPVLIAVNDNNTGVEVNYSSSTTGLASRTGTMTGLSSDAIVGDFDADGDLDIMASRPVGHRSFENRPMGWNNDNHNDVVNLTNATMFDHDHNNNASIFLPFQTIPDGNMLTLDGNITYHGFRSGGWGGNAYDNRIDFSAQATGVIEPWTAPRALFLGDLDGDGEAEHLVLAGEGTLYGVFLSAWHIIGYDTDSNGMADFTTQGYAGNGSNGLSMLSLTSNSIGLSADLNAIIPGLTASSDGYGIQMVSLNFLMHSRTSGQFTFSDLSIHYVADFLVNVNPHLTGNLSNILNQRMTTGTGTLHVPLYFIATQNGSFVLHSPNINYEDGAPIISLPPTPQLKLVELTHNRVIFEWQNLTDFGDDLLNFAVYRTQNGQLPNMQIPLSTTLSNTSLDLSVQPGQEFSYWVRSIHQYGVTSNLSLPLNVTVPYPLPKSYIPNVVATDVPDDAGGVMNITWDKGDASVVEHRIYVYGTDFSSLANKTASHVTNASTFTIEIQTDSDGLALVDGSPYYVAVVGYDSYGNASDNVSTFGPAYTRNNTALPTTLVVTYSALPEEENIPYILLSRQGAFVMDAYLYQDGQAIPDMLLTLHVIEESGAEFTATATTDAIGHAQISFQRLLDIGSTLLASGPIDLKVTFDGLSDDPSMQPLLPTSTLDEAYGTIPITLKGDSVIELDDDFQFSTEFDVDTADMLYYGDLANVNVFWAATTSDGKLADEGAAEVKGNVLLIEGTGVYDGTLSIYLDIEPPVFYVPGMALHVGFERDPDAPNNEGNETGNTTTGGGNFPDVTLAAEVSCQQKFIAWTDNGSDESMTCTVQNPNPFEVQLGFSWKIIPTTPPPIQFLYDQEQQTVMIEANGSVDISFHIQRNGPSDGLYPGQQGLGYVLTLTCADVETNLCATMSAPSATKIAELQWTLGEFVYDDDDTSNTQQDSTSSAMTPVLVGIGLFLALAFAVGGVLMMRRKPHIDWHEEDDEAFYDRAMESSSPQQSALDLSASRTLGELKDSGKQFYDSAPEGLAQSALLGSKADVFSVDQSDEAESVASDEDGEDVLEDDSQDEQTSEGEESAITVDENGTEWWEDNDGVWWYREQGWDDWAVWES